ncbi:tetratricopeptide repeat protein [Alkalimarinus alittae]|uniref:Tetratricopeptide repeat protein n=1 Tax=Alkalimarinus alittae TaxID=2961619 RepID=A0ABY6N6P8_9ALTE|nr:hypothetical protein [Alkalimarinus alittae]UZE97805.1 hypothetical protein NKI27_08750 [Alkalimarinus alittae]
MIRLLSPHYVAGVFAVLISFTAISPNAVQANDSTTSKLPDRLATGMMLYELHQDNFFDAIIRSSNLTDEQMVLHLALSESRFGLTDQAKEQYDHLRATGSDKARATAFFQLGVMAYNQSDWSSALEWFKKAERNIDKSLLPELQYYKANVYIHEEKHNTAAKILGQMSAGLWASYAYYNLAMSYAAMDSEPTRSIISLRVADALNPKDSATLIELKDQIALSAGYLAVQAEDYDKALSFLNQVRVNSDLAAKALYMHGVANASKDQYRAAIQSWYRVKKYPLINTGVADAFLAIPYAYDKEGYSSKAISTYLEAISVFDKEIRNIEKITDAVSKDGASHVFFETSSLDDIEWFLSDSIATNTPKVAYFKLIMSDSRLHHQAKQSIEFERLYQNLKLWEYNLSVYDDMLKDRIKGYHQRIKKTNTAKRTKHINTIAHQAEVLKQSFSEASKNQDLMAVSAGTTLRRFDSVDALNQRLKKLKKTLPLGEYQTLSKRVQRLQGLVKWEAKEQYERNLRLNEETLMSLAKEIERYEQGLKNFEVMISKGPKKLQAFKLKVSSYKEKVKKIKHDVSRFREQQNKKLTEQVLTMLSEKKAEFVAHHETAQQRLVHLYEFVAMTQHAIKNKSTKGGEK